MKIYVYAIARNEAVNAEAWYKSMSEADGVFVLDTGSTDDTATILEKCGAVVKVHNFAEGEFRFDVARNESLAMIPDDADLCVCTDLDERFTEGWRKQVEGQWVLNFADHPETNCAEYTYWHTMDANGNPVYQFNNFKIHKPKVAKWHYACHEVLEYTDERKPMFIKDIILKHYQIKNERRGAFYLSLLERAAKEEPNDARASHYYGRELMYHERWEDAIAEFMRHLAIKDGWNAERAQSMRFIARCHATLKRTQDAYYWYTKAIAECTHQRESACEFAQYAAEQNDWEVCEFAAKSALLVSDKIPIYLTEDWCWGGIPWHYYSLGLANKPHGDFRKAGIAASVACRLSPYDENIWRNMISKNGQAPVYPQIPAVEQLLSEYYKRDNDIQRTPNWGELFDHVYCIHYLGNANREEQMKREFSRIGLWGNSIFTVWETVRTVYEDQLPNQNECAGIKNLALQTLRILITAKTKGYKRILIWEDDVCMLKDLGLFSTIFEATPKDKDIVLYDKMCFIHWNAFRDHAEKNRINDWFASWQTGLYSGSCYAVNETAYDKLIALYSEKLIAPDDATQIEGLSKAYAIINTSCQRFCEGGMFPERFGGFNTKNGYAFQGLSYSLYNVGADYGYDEPLNAEECF